jgi:hypothetical protein
MNRKLLDYKMIKYSEFLQDQRKINRALGIKKINANIFTEYIAQTLLLKIRN